MSEPWQGMTLTLVDTTGIQAYIFGTNTLRHHVGASWLVDWATQEAVAITVIQIANGAKTNLDQAGNLLEAVGIEDQTVTAELLYSGGGNAVLIFRLHATAVAFTQALTRLVLERAPGLQLVVTHVPLDWQRDGLAAKLDELRQRANRKKGNRRHSLPLLGLGVTADCQFTDLPAETEWRAGDGARQRVSGEVRAKLAHFGQADERLRKEVGTVRWQHLEFAYDFDDIGDRGESSYLAVVHIDGNGMGARFEAIAQAHQQPTQNRAYVRAVRRLSDRIKQIARRALQSTVDELQQAIRKTEPGQGKIGGRVPVNQQRLPFRPIVYGGDDVTFVCDGRLGLTLAAHYLEQMEQPLDEPTPDCTLPDKLYVRAGIAVVNTHYPFARAYEMAEALAASAKSYLQTVASDKRVSALDWHFAVNGLVLTLDELRERDYQTPDGDLTMRPLLLRVYDDAARWRTWPFFAEMTTGFLEDKEWAERRSKVKGYGEALRAGPAAAEQYLKAFLPAHVIDNLPAPPGEPGVKRTGWRSKQAVHFDAIEALDFFVALQPDAGVPPAAAVQATPKGGTA